jgi:DNA-binding transcriptional regulator YhcF (GntR family)
MFCLMFAMPSNIDAFGVQLVAGQATPLYRQLAEGLRYQISRGVLGAGARLPALRAGARAWGVNLHTVRRAYRELAQLGLIEVRRPAGAYVAPEQGGVARRAEDAFAQTVIADGRRRFGLDAHGVVALLARTASPPRTAVVHVVECSRTLAQSLADQITKRFGVRTEPCLVDDVGDVGPGPIIATYFHLNDVRVRIPDRLGDVRFVTIEPALDRAAAVVRRAKRAGNPVTLCERDPLLAPAIAHDVRGLLGGRVDVVVDVKSNPSSLIKKGRDPVVFSPKSWDLLDDAQRRNPAAFLLDYRLGPGALVDGW